MSKALFAYDAWNSITFAAEEVKDPQKNLPRSLLLGTVGVTLIYCTAVAIYLYMVPITEMFAVKDNRIAAEAASRALGPAGVAFVAAAILISTFGCVSGALFFMNSMERSTPDACRCTWGFAGAPAEIASKSQLILLRMPR